MSEEFSVDTEAIDAIKDILVKLREQAPKDRLEYALFASNNFTVLQKFVEIVSVMCGDVNIAHRAPEHVLKRAFDVSISLIEDICAFDVEYLNAVPTRVIIEQRKEKGIKQKLTRLFS